MPFARAEDACEIHYEVHGAHGTPVLMAAGMGGSGRFWQPQLDELSARHRVVVFDQAGTGRSSREIRGELSVARLARDAAAVLDAAGFAAAHFVGHAIGGIIGMALAAHSPGRMLSLTVINGWARADAYLRRCFEVRKDILVRSGPRAYLRAQPIFLFPPRWIAEHDARLEAELSEQLAGFPDTGTMLRPIDTFVEFDATGLLGAIRAPALIVAARDDALVPCHLSDALLRGIRGARHELVDAGAHAFTVVHPERLAAPLLAFLAEHDSPAGPPARAPA